ncbi:hypothetical protein [Cytobacillus sp. IB215665]|uniref:hypothetical protein n=1 Tax=Cytobacillus sp. IB215665 TaxID=3097357 RepID=UPI002A11FC4E|nr:hypothetical protein [Cytobacillus sp. IB215665]MDX8365704.1 hypothetical protein [Cytobacillus sp. IB215665]
MSQKDLSKIIIIVAGTGLILFGIIIIFKSYSFADYLMRNKFFSRSSVRSPDPSDMLLATKLYFASCLSVGILTTLGGMFTTTIGLVKKH